MAETLQESRASEQTQEKTVSINSKTDCQTCSICLEAVIIGHRATAALACLHQFHLDCIGSAFNAKGAMECPNCRRCDSGNWLYASGPIASALGHEALGADEFWYEYHEDHVRGMAEPGPGPTQDRLDLSQSLPGLYGHLAANHTEFEHPDSIIDPHFFHRHGHDSSAGSPSYAAERQAQRMLNALRAELGHGQVDDDDTEEGQIVFDQTSSSLNHDHEREDGELVEDNAGDNEPEDGELVEDHTAVTDVEFTGALLRSAQLCGSEAELGVAEGRDFDDADFRTALLRSVQLGANTAQLSEAADEWLGADCTQEDGDDVDVYMSRNAATRVVEQFYDSPEPRHEWWGDRDDAAVVEEARERFGWPDEEQHAEEAVHGIGGSGSGWGNAQTTEWSDQRRRCANPGPPLLPHLGMPAIRSRGSQPQPHPQSSMDRVPLPPLQQHYMQSHSSRNLSDPTAPRHADRVEHDSRHRAYDDAQRRPHNSRGSSCDGTDTDWSGRWRSVPNRGANGGEDGMGSEYSGQIHGSGSSAGSSSGDDRRVWGRASAHGGAWEASSQGRAELLLHAGSRSDAPSGAPQPSPDRPFPPSPTVSELGRIFGHLGHNDSLAERAEAYVNDGHHHQGTDAQGTGCACGHVQCSADDCFCPCHLTTRQAVRSGLDTERLVAAYQNYLMEFAASQGDLGQTVSVMSDEREEGELDRSSHVLLSEGHYEALDGSVPPGSRHGSESRPRKRGAPPGWPGLRRDRSGESLHSGSSPSEQTMSVTGQWMATPRNDPDWPSTGSVSRSGPSGQRSSPRDSQGLLVASRHRSPAPGTWVSDHVAGLDERSRQWLQVHEQALDQPHAQLVPEVDHPHQRSEEGSTSSYGRFLGTYMEIVERHLMRVGTGESYDPALRDSRGGPQWS